MINLYHSENDSFIVLYISIFGYDEKIVIFFFKTCKNFYRVFNFILGLEIHLNILFYYEIDFDVPLFFVKVKVSPARVCWQFVFTDHFHRISFLFLQYTTQGYPKIIWTWNETIMWKNLWSINIKWYDEDIISVEKNSSNNCFWGFKILFNFTICWLFPWRWKKWSTHLIM